MAHNSKQEVALRRKYVANRDETRSAFERALVALEAKTDIAITERTLYEAAGRSRATLNRYPDIKERLAALRRKRSLSTQEQATKVSAGNSPSSGQLRDVLRERDTLAQRVSILSLAVQDLERRNAALVRLLHQNHIVAPMELVVDNTKEK